MRKAGLTKNQPPVDMSESKALTTREQKRALLAQQAREIDEAAQGAAALFHGAEVSTEKELLLAMAVVDLRKALTPEVMEPIMSLMNSPLGFLTDKDPSKPSKGQDGSWQVPKPYDVETVRDCVISCKMLGFRVVGNEFNIIAGKFYPAKGGYRRKLTDKLSFPGLTDFRDTYEVPRMVGDKGAIVKCKATWKRNGVEDSLECEFAVRNNANMGTDALLGKAERKLCKRVHDILLGASTPDAEIDEDALKAANASPASTPAATVEVRVRHGEEDQIPGAETTAKQSPEGASPQTGGERVTTTTDGGNGAAEPQATKQAPPAPPSNSRVAIFRKFLSDSGISEKAAMDQIHKMFRETDSLAGLDDVEAIAPHVINGILRTKAGWVAEIRAGTKDGSLPL
jgi:hypothetical protein